MKSDAQAIPSKLTLYDKAIRAGVWTIGSHATEFVTRLFSTLIMTRLLFPEAFGLMAAVTSILVGLALVSDFGIRTIILQSPEGSQVAFLRTAWTLQACRGVVMWLTLAFICVLMSLSRIRELLPPNSVFAEPQFSSVALVMGLSLIASGFESTTLHLNVRELTLKPIFLLDLVTRTVTLPIMIFWAWVSPSVWALVGGALVASILRLGLSHTFVPGPHMSLHWDRDQVREIVHFGKWINVASVTTFLATQTDRFILGFFLSTSAFGLYSIARTLIDAGQGVFERLNATLALPIFSEIIRRDHKILRDRYYRFRIPFDFCAPMLAGLLTSAGGLLVYVLFDHRYADAGGIVQILALGLVIFPSSLLGSAFTANCEPRIGAIVSLARALSLIACLSCGYLVTGARGAIFGAAIHGIFPTTILLIIGRKRGWVDLSKELRVMPVFAIGFLIGELAVMAARVAFRDPIS